MRPPYLGYLGYLGGLIVEACVDNQLFRWSPLSCTYEVPKATSTSFPGGAPTPALRHSLLGIVMWMFLGPQSWPLIPIRPPNRPL